MLLTSALTAADPVPVKVVEVAGGFAYLTPGRAAGIVPGTQVRLRGVDVEVIEVTERTAVVRIAAARVAIGDTGKAEVTAGDAPARSLAKPHPAEAFRGQWRDPVLPASEQQPQAVPLGAARAAGAAHVTVIGHTFGAADQAHTGAQAEGRVIAAFDLLTDRPLAAELDVAARWFSDGYNASTRTPVFVRAAELRYGTADDPRLALGRLRFASIAVGMLDGGRASVRTGGLELAAFGGVVPDPLSGKPDTAATRFGGELTYDAPDAPWQPRVAIAAHGSTWDGQLDERRLSIAGSAGRDAWWLDGYAEAQAFDAGNPWGADAVELTSAGATAEWRRHGSHAGIDLTFLRPERSLRLAAALPPEWLCRLAPPPGGAPVCATGDWWASATASFGTRTPRWGLDGGVTLGDSQGQYSGGDRSGYVRGELHLGTGQLTGGLSGGQASFASWTALELGAAYAPTRALSLGLTYRPELLDYAASTGPSALQSMIFDARVTLSATLELALSALATTGVDRDALALLATFVWRPLP
ncbi:MAG: hypothetical protein ABIY55_31165 [Kofleriaceae bacterium]